MKILQINSVYKVGSTGSIMSDISDKIKEAGGESYIACGYDYIPCENEYLINNRLEKKVNIFKSHLFGLQGFYNKPETEKLLKWIDNVQPDIVHLHNIHGHYVNCGQLFKYLAEKKIKIVWTLHDCWAFTGHCAHFASVGCDKWQSGCNNCPNLKAYPANWLFDRSEKSWNLKKEIFNLPDKENMIFAATSDWVRGIQQKSFLSEYGCVTINNGIDINVFNINADTKFRNTICREDEFLVMGYAGKWLNPKNAGEIKFLTENLPDNVKIVLVGCKNEDLSRFKGRFVPVPFVSDKRLLSQYYSAADVFVNLTLEDTFPTVNMESLACGTPVITNDVCGSAEIIDESAGIKTQKGNEKEMLDAIMTVYNRRDLYTVEACRGRAKEKYDKEKCFKKYIELYERLV